jgi:hypothetical protein
MKISRRGWLAIALIFISLVTFWGGTPAIIITAHKSPIWNVMAVLVMFWLASLGIMDTMRWYHHGGSPAQAEDDDPRPRI